jgi:hypothetical protein
MTFWSDVLLTSRSHGTGFLPSWYTWTGHSTICIQTMESLPARSCSVYGSSGNSSSSSSLLVTTMTPLRRHQPHNLWNSSSHNVVDPLKGSTPSAMPVAPQYYSTEDNLSLRVVDHGDYCRRRQRYGTDAGHRKQVTFDPDLCVVYEYADPCACPDDLYYTPQERLEMQVEYRSLVKSFTRSHRQRCAQFDRLFDGDEILVARANDHNDETSQLLQELSLVRGLESTFSKAMHRHRKSSIQSVLNLQESMQQHQRQRMSSSPLHSLAPQQHFASANANLLALGLRACSVHASQKSRTLAQCLAALDAVAAAAGLDHGNGNDDE